MTAAQVTPAVQTAVQANQVAQTDVTDPKQSSRSSTNCVVYW